MYTDVVYHVQNVLYHVKNKVYHVQKQSVSYANVLSFILHQPNILLYGHFRLEYFYIFPCAGRLGDGYSNVSLI